MLKFPSLLFLTVIPLIFTALYLSMSGKAFEQFYTYSHLSDKKNKKNAFLLKRNIPALLICTAAFSIITALSSPFRFSEPVRIVSENSITVKDYSFAVDISNSMTADDSGISRLEQAKNTLISFIFSDSDNSRYSVTIFKGSAAVILPLTSDKKLAVSVIEKLSPDMFTSRGTLFSSAVESAASVFPDHEKTERKMIIFTDGEESENGSLEKDMEKLAGIIRREIIDIVIIMPDSSSGSIVPDSNSAHVSIPDFSLMEKASEIWGGRVVRNSDFSASSFQNTVYSPGQEKDYKGFFLFLSFVFMFSASAAGRIRL